MKCKRIIIGITVGIIAAALWECCFYKLIKQHGRNWNRNMSGYIVWYIWQSLFFRKKIKISDDTTCW